MLIAIIVIAAIAAGWGISQYNSLVGMRALVEEAYSTMDVYLKKRSDLIPNLVETVKGYMTHEEETLAKVIELRNSAVSASRQDSPEAEAALSEGIGRLFALAENYPELKADTQFTALQENLRGIEDEISQSRKYYNGAVRNFNTAITRFPASMIASRKGFYEYAYYQTDEASRENVKVSF
ncbi:MAG: LemA family protein [Eubacteriaceae bacterium]|nr:LemA family protein [Eubacteriaceae bacterium]